MDYHCHHRDRPLRYRTGTRLLRRMDCRGDHFGGLFRGQDISTFRYDHSCLIGNGHTSFQTYPLHDDHNSSLYVDHARYLHGSRSFTRSDGDRPDRTILDRPEQYVPYHTVAADRTGRHWHPDCEKSSIDHHAVHFGGIGRHVRVDFPATPVAGNFRFTGRKHPIQFQGPINDILRQYKHKNRKSGTE